jgi:Uma2 family endonuclease
MNVRPKYTSRDLETLPDVEGKRYEIIDGDLFVSKQPSWDHQFAAGEVHRALQNWSHSSGLGWAVQAPGLIFDDDDDVVPDIVWVSHQRRRSGLDSAGHLRIAPELAVEVVSPGSRNEQRDRAFKLTLYSRQGVREYWIIDPRQRMVQLYRREDQMLELVATLWSADTLTSPILPGFELPVADLWEPA